MKMLLLYDLFIESVCNWSYEYKAVSKLNKDYGRKALYTYTVDYLDCIRVFYASWKP